MLHIPDFLKKKPRDEDETPQVQNVLLKYWLPISVGVLCLLLVCGYFLKVILTDKSKVAPPAQSYDCCATVAAVGDISMSAKQLRTFRTDSGDYSFDNCFRQVAQSISAADIAVGNLEGTLTNDIAKAQSNAYPVEYISALADCGFDLLQTANSFSIQKGLSSIQLTMDAVEKFGMEALGTFRSPEERSECGGVRIVDVNGIRIAFLAFTKGLNNMHLPDGSEYAVNLLFNDYDTEYSQINADGIIECINNAKNASPDFIFAMVHWGSENGTEINETQGQIANLLIDNGVDVVLGSHSHIVGKIEKRPVLQNDGSWKNTYIAYSLGDFMTASEQSKTQYSCILNLKLEKDSQTGAHAITEISYTPTYCTSPSKSLGTSQYEVIDSLNAIQLRKEQYYNAVSESLCDKLLQTLDALKEQTQTDYQIEKLYDGE